MLNECGDVFVVRGGESVVRFGDRWKWSGIKFRGFLGWSVCQKVDGVEEFFGVMNRCGVMCVLCDRKKVVGFVLSGHFADALDGEFAFKE